VVSGFRRLCLALDPGCHMARRCETSSISSGPGTVGGELKKTKEGAGYSGQCAILFGKRWAFLGLQIVSSSTWVKFGDTYEGKILQTLGLPRPGMRRESPVSRRDGLDRYPAFVARCLLQCALMGHSSAYLKENKIIIVKPNPNRAFSPCPEMPILVSSHQNVQCCAIIHSREVQTLSSQKGYLIFPLDLCIPARFNMHRRLRDLSLSNYLPLPFLSRLCPSPMRPRW
jgi:hypothetical protein